MSNDRKAAYEKLIVDVVLYRGNDGLPVIPPLPEPVAPQGDGAIAVCGLCGLRLMPVMGYVCTNQRCGVFSHGTCVASSAP